MLTKFKNNKIFHLIILSLVTFLTYSPALRMYFYSDDFGDIYLLVRGLIKYSYPPTSIDVSHYILILLYPYFGINPMGYFAIGIGIVILTVILLYLFASNLFKNNILGLIAGLVYATSPIGISSVFQLLTFYTESGYIVTLMLLTILLLFQRALQKNSWIYYLIVTFMLNVFLSVHQRRGFFLVPILFLMDYFLSLKLTSSKSIKLFIPNKLTLIRQIPIFLIFVYSYSQIPSLSQIFSGTFIASRNIDAHAKFTMLIHSVFLDVKPLVSMANILAGVPLIFFSDNNIDLDVSKHRDIWTAFVLTIALGLVILGFKIKRQWGFFLLFFLGWMYSSVIGFYVFSSPGISETIARTLTLAAPAFGLFAALSGFVLYTFIKSKKFVSDDILNTVTVLITTLFIEINFIASYSYLEKFNQKRSQYAYKFYSDIKVVQPTIPPNSLIFIETSKDPQFKSRLYNIYKGNSYGAGGTLGIYYGLSYKELEFVDSYDDALKLIKDGKFKIDHVFSFHYNDDASLTDITENIRYNLEADLKLIPDRTLLKYNKL